MTEPSFALQLAVARVLKAAPPLAALVGDRVLDRIPIAAPMPYIRVGDDQVVPDPAEGLSRSIEIHAAIHAWSSLPGRMEAKRIAGAIVDALDDAALDLGPDLALVLIRHDGTRYLDDPSGTLTHAVVSFLVLVDRAA